MENFHAARSIYLETARRDSDSSSYSYSYSTASGDRRRVRSIHDVRGIHRVHCVSRVCHGSNAGCTSVTKRMGCPGSGRRNRSERRLRRRSDLCRGTWLGTGLGPLSTQRRSWGSFDVRRRNADRVRTARSHSVRRSFEPPWRCRVRWSWRRFDTQVELGRLCREHNRDSAWRGDWLASRDRRDAPFLCIRGTLVCAVLRRHKKWRTGARRDRGGCGPHRVTRRDPRG
jgi:hypothetical protein